MMRVALHEVTKGRRGQALPSTSLSFSSAAAVLAVAETEQRPAVLGLIASGRMRPDTGTVGLDEDAHPRAASHHLDAAALRRRVALVDAPDVCDPAPNLTVAGVAAEELMFAGRLSAPLAVRRWLDENGFRPLARVAIADVAPRERIRLLLELTALRVDVEAMVLVSPDRHGGDPAEWWMLAEDFAERGFAMLVIAGAASALVLEGRAPRADAVDVHPEPVQPAEAVEPAEAAEPVQLVEAPEASEASEIRRTTHNSDDSDQSLRSSGRAPNDEDARPQPQPPTPTGTAEETR